MSRNGHDYTYNRGGRVPSKHQSTEPDAHFEQIGSVFIGKCAASITDQVALQLLNDAIPDGTLSNGLPQRFYAIHDGVPYIATWTNRGRDVHGFPWRFRDPSSRMPRSIERQLRKRAEEQGDEQKFRHWMKMYGRSKGSC